MTEKTQIGKSGIGPILGCHLITVTFAVSNLLGLTEMSWWIVAAPALFCYVALLHVCLTMGVVGHAIDKALLAQRIQTMEDIDAVLSNMDDDDEEDPADAHKRS